MAYRPKQHKPARFKGSQRSQDATSRAENLRWLNRKAWRDTSNAYLNENPLCVECQVNGTLTPATEVDHKKPRHKRPDLAYDWDNLQALCKSCHSRKTVREDGGFGRTQGKR